MAKYGPRYVPKEVRYLREHGPTPRPELEDAGIEPQGRYRHYDVRRLNVGRSPGRTNCGIGRVTPVRYLPEHDLETVVRTFIDANPAMLDRPKAGVTQYFGKDSHAMRDAWQAVADDYADEMPTRKNQDVSPSEPSCDICGEDVPAAHMTDHMVAHARGELDGDGSE